MVLKGILSRLGIKEEEETHPSPNPVGGNDGWVELQNGRILVHDPVADGRYATLTPEPGVRLWINDEEVTETTAVTASDRIRYETAPDPHAFYDIAVAPDDMSVTLTLTSDPHRLPDTITLVDRTHARLQLAYSGKAKQRPFQPKVLILEKLRSLGVTFGVSTEAIDKELSSPTYQPVVIARGQEARAPVSGQWLWKLNEWSLVEAGQIIAQFQGGAPNQPRITVKGHSEKLFEDLPEVPAYLPGNGTRIVPGDKLVASASGRARAVPTPHGQRVHIFPVHRVDGDLTGPLDMKADVLVMGNVRDAQVTVTGELFVKGVVDKSVIKADVITVQGTVSDSKLYTANVGTFLPLKGELLYLQQKLEAMRDLIHSRQPVGDENFRDATNAVRSLRRRHEQMPVTHEEYLAVMNDVAKVFMGGQSVTGIDLPTAGRLLVGLGKLTKAAEQASVGAKTVRAANLHHSIVWSQHEIEIAEKAVSCYLYAGGSLKGSSKSAIAQCEVIVGEDVRVGSIVRGGTVIRFGGVVQAGEIQVGTVLEFGADHKEFKNDVTRVTASLNKKGQIVVKQSEA